ncbi:Uncharacterised protein [Candidatus Ornithobacterium hominis]|uniref:Substrate import-associated zinc metallohydrolase lipoprotein n=1 Tax=Candidatus Ornithobacterium hominis TaxID=2497989 RepID=A0A383U1R5_9FLAO|nr:putative zinc-binding metallopeptidase [Candidatus Ornithobacterium hominis]MCT7904911.1 putative zinc-binding metallopeptidase [Candidatus Ornithobacterium hominis]SZD73418.1 Uncharacterised protein [Candidatus Ornithobacterium hominis]
MKNIKITSMLLGAFLLLGGCQEDNVDKNVDVITVDDRQQTEFDEYLKTIFTDKYNIKFIYKWDDKESDTNYALVPARLSKSVQMANIVKYLALDAYESVAPDDFLKKYFPKTIMLVGSAAYRNNGTMVLGTAEGGVKITLYDVNKLNDIQGKTEEELQPIIQRLFEFYFRTIFHEFSHILHQTVDYTPAFQQISETDYVGGEWNKAWEDGESLKKGFISDYSSKERNEDFVELIAHYITTSPEKWEEKLNAAGKEGATKINQKMNIISTYMEEKWSIDINELRDEVLRRAAKLNEIDLNKTNA